MSTSAVPDFTALLDSVIGRTGTQRKEKEAPKTIEEALAKQGDEATVSVGVVSEDKALPIPHSDMTLGEMKELMEKLAKVVDKGAYLFEWTGGKGAKNGNLNPLELGRERMTEEEKIAYDWWQANGDQEEYDWRNLRETGTVPAGKIGKYNNELAALRYMYGKGDLKMENWFWLRKNSEARAHVVWALTKIIAANQDLVNGRDSSDALGMAEYQTTLKIISEASSFVRVFMENVHKALKPIDTSLNKVIARKIAVGKRIGIEQKKEGTANRLSERYGGGKVGVISNPDDVPRGIRRQRDTTMTIDELRRLKIAKTDMTHKPTSGPISNIVSATSTGMEIDPDTGASTSGTGAMARATVPQDATDDERDAVLNLIRMGNIDEDKMKAISPIAKWSVRRGLVLKQISKTRARSLEKVLVPAAATNKERIIISAASAALTRKYLSIDELEIWAKKVDWLNMLLATHLFTEPEDVGQMVADLGKAADA